jgi:vibriolysin
VTGVGAGGPVAIIARNNANPSESQIASITVLKGFIKNISGATDSENIWTIDVPAGATKLTVTIAGGTGDVDMYVRYNATPTGSGDNCKSEKAGNGESCVINNPTPGKWYILGYGFEAYAGATLTVLYESP